MVRMSLDELHLPCSVRLNGPNTQTDLSRNPLTNTMIIIQHPRSVFNCIKFYILEVDKTSIQIFLKVSRSSIKFFTSSPEILQHLRVSVLPFKEAHQRKWRHFNMSLWVCFIPPASMSNLVGRKWFDLLQAWGILESNRLNHKDQRSPANLGFSCRHMRSSPLSFGACGAAFWAFHSLDLPKQPSHLSPLWCLP